MTAQLKGRRVLVVEDEFLIALETQQTLESLGVETIGPTFSVEEALAATGESMDAAVLDVNLSGRSSAPVAEALLKRHVPIVFASGYGNKISSFGNAPVLDKPFSREQLAQALLRVLPPLEPSGGRTN